MTEHLLLRSWGVESPAIAIHVGVCTGAENIVFPYKDVDYQRIADDIKRGIEGKQVPLLLLEREIKQVFHRSSKNS